MELEPLDFDPFPAPAGTAPKPAPVLEPIDFDPFPVAASQPEPQGWYESTAQTARDSISKSAIGRGFTAGMLKENPDNLGNAVEGFGYLSGSTWAVDQGKSIQDWAKTAGGVSKQGTGILDSDSLDSFLTNVGETFGSGVASTLPSVVAGVGGAAVGSVAGPVGTIGGGLVGAGSASYVQSFGELYGALKEAGVDPQRAAELSKYGTVPIASLDMIGLGGMAKPFIGEARREIVHGLARRIATEAAKGATTEGITEAAQEFLKDATVTYETGRPLFTAERAKGWAEAGIGGALVGGAVDAGAGFRRPEMRRDPNAPDPALPPPKPGDIESPIPTADIQRGRAMMDALIEGRMEEAMGLGRPGQAPAPAAPGPAPSAPTPEPVAPRGYEPLYDDEDPELQVGWINPRTGDVRGLNRGASNEGTAAAPEPVSAAEAAPPLERPAPGGQTAPVSEGLKTNSSSSSAPEDEFGQMLTGRPTAADVRRIGVTGAATGGMVAPIAAPASLPSGDGSRAAPVKVEHPDHVDVAAARAQTAPSDGQKEAGNYQKGHLRLGGMDITIDTPKDAERSGTAPDGTRWSVKMPAHYGYVKRSEGADGDQVDVYIGPEADTGRVFVFDQFDPKTRRFDEHKAVLGVRSIEDAQDLYDGGFSDGSGPRRRGGVTEMSTDEFRTWAMSGDTSKPLGEVATSAPKKPKTWDETLPTAPPAADEPPLAPNAFRLYRGEGGTMMGSEAGGRWFTTSRSKAEKYAEGGGRVVYVDIDKADRRSLMGLGQGAGGADEVLTDVPSILKAVKPLGKASPAPVNTTPKPQNSATDRAPEAPAGTTPQPPETKIERAKRRAREMVAEGKTVGDIQRALRAEGASNVEVTAATREAVKAMEAAEETATPKPDTPAAKPRNPKLVPVSKRTKEPPPRRAIGENRFGQPVFEDERGVRSYVADGIRMTESVATAPDGSTSVRKDARSESFKTRAESEAEIEQRRAARNTNVEGLVRSMAGDGKTWAEVLSALKETGPLSDEDLRRAARAFREAENDTGPGQPGNRKAQATRTPPVEDDRERQRRENVRKLEEAESRASPPKAALDRKWDGKPSDIKAASTPGKHPFARQKAILRAWVGSLSDAEYRSLTEMGVYGFPTVLSDTMEPGRMLEAFQQSLKAGEPVFLPEGKYLETLDRTAQALLGEPAQEPKKPEGYGEANKVFTADAAEKARAILRAKLKNQVSSGLDPEIVQAGITLAGYHIEAGARKFADYSRAMVADLGEEVRPYLRSWYEGVRWYPGFDAAGMSTAEEIAAEEGRATDGNEPGIRASEEGVREPEGAVPSGRAPADAPAPEGERKTAGAPGSDRRGSRPGVREPRDAAPDEPGRAEGAGRTDGILPADSADGGGDRAGRRRQRAAKPVAEAAQDQVREDRAARARKNYRITTEDKIGQGGPKERVRANIEAIRVLKRIEEEKRPATADEKRALVKYVGWGAFAQPIFDPRPRAEWKDERAAVFDLLTPEEIAAARKSTLNAHYTSEAVIRGMWRALDHLGFKGGRALEPSAGVGHFIGLTPDAVLDKTAWSAVELDTTTGRIAQLLYEGSDVNVQGFETFKRPAGFFDLAVSNVPFGDFTLRDPDRPGLLIHDYFFVKGLDLVRPGGIVSFITSSGTMDKLDKKARRMILDRADFLGAIRLPGGDRGAFAGNAGTEVTTDIIFLRRRGPGQDARHAGDFLETKRVETPEGSTAINAYFADNPAMMLGEMRLVGSMYRANSPVLVGSAEGIEDRIAQAAVKMEAGAMLPRQSAARITKEPETDTNAPGEKEGAIYLKGGKAFRKVNGVGQEMRLSAGDMKKLPGFIAMRDAVNALLSRQARGERKGGDQLRQSLTKAYDAFVAAHGPINLVVETVQTRADKKTGATRQVTIRRMPNFTPFADDPDAYKTAAIEEYDEQTGKAKKAAIFTTDIVGGYSPPEVTGPADAIAVSLNERGRIDIPLIAQRMGISEAAAIRELGDLVFEDPVSGDWRTAGDYLSGDVVTALEQARAGAKSDPDKFTRNVDALEKVQPAPLTRVDIRVNLGAPWVPADVYEAFLRSIGGRNITVRSNPITKSVQVTDGYFDASAQSAYGTSRASALDVVNAALKQTSFKIYDKGADDKPVVNEAASQEVLVKIGALREAFAGNPEAGIEGWVWGEDARSERLEALYNANFNRLVPTVYDGSHMALPGLAKSIVSRTGDIVPFSLRPHQKDAVWRVVQSGNTLLDHVVGAGKTFTMIAAGMEQKRLGLVQRPMYVVPNHMLEQFSREFYQAYPNAKLLVATKDQMTKDRRKEFAARVAADKWDGIIITHDAFGRITMSRAAYERYMNEEIERYERAKEAAAADEGAKSPTVKELEKAKKKLEERLKKLLNEERKDDGTTFEEMGIDYLVLDEAHLFKNLRIATRHTRVKGIGKSASQRAEDLFIKIQTLEKSRPGRAALFATGTPISNTMAEMFVMQRYLQNDTLREYGVDDFDAWAATFGEITTQMELAPNGRTFQETTSFAKFVNIPELVSLYSKVADVKTAEMLNLPRPKLRGGKIQVVEAEPSREEEDYISSLVDRAAVMKGKRVEKGGDNMLKIVSEGRKVATDFRLLRPETTINPDGKIAKAVDTIYRVWKDGKEPGLAQIVFLDMGVPTGAKAATEIAPEPETRMEGDEGEDGADIESSILYESRFNLYEDIRSRLVARGVPKEQVAFVHEATDDIKKAALFKKVRTGEVRVLIGSTGKMGVGTNVQDRLIAMHHLDAPWKPAEVEQRDGRIIRQGNMNPEVDMFRYITKRSFDSFMWQALERKSRFIAQIKAGARGIRSAEDIDDPLPEAAALKAAASGDLRVIEHAELSKEVRDLEHQQRNHDRNIQRAKGSLVAAREQMTALESQGEQLAADAAKVKDISGDKFAVSFQFSRDGAITDRKAAGESLRRWLVAAGQSIWSPAPTTLKLGEIGGLPMQADMRRTSEGMIVEPVVRGSGVYASRAFLLVEDADPMGMIGRWERIIRDVPVMAAEMPARIQAKREEIARLEKQARDAVFPKADRLKETKRRLIELEAALRPKDPAKAAEADAGPTKMQYALAPAGWGEVEAMPTPKLSAAEMDEIAEVVRRVAGLEEVNVKDTIPIPANSPGAKAWGRTEAGRASAFYSGISDTITIALDMPEGAGRRVAYHEAFHRLQNLYLTDKERAVLKAESDRLREIVAKSMARGRAVADRMAQSEVEAEAFSLYTVAKERGGPDVARFPLRVRPVFAKLDRIVRAVRNWLNGRGFQTYEDVFGRAAEGRTALRTARGITGTTVMDDFSMIDEDQSDETEDLDFGAARRSMGEALFTRNATMLQRVRSATNRDAVSETEDRWRYAVQDIVIDLKQVQREIVEVLGPLAESQNPYLAYELSESRAGPRLEALHEDMVSPMLARMKAAGISIEDLDEYLYAKHAPERNARIAEINPKIPEGGSGMTDEEAASIVDRVESGPKARDYARLASLVYEINDFALQTRLEAGLLSEEQADAWRQSYEFYVPLRGFAEMDPDSFEDRPNLGGSGVNVRGKESQRALGRESRAADITAHAIMQAQEAIARAERNKVGQALYELATAAPNKDFWRADPVKTKAVWNKKLQQVVYQRVHALSRTEEDHTVFLKIGGQEHRVSFNMKNPRARRLAEGMRRLKGKDWGAVVRTFGMINRYLSTVNTTLSPEFIITNAFKDLQTAMVNIGQYDVEGIRKRTLKHFGSVWKGLIRLKSPQQRDEWKGWYDEFIASGGRTYWNDVESVQEIARRLEAEINPSNSLGARSWRGAKSVFKVIETANNNVENAIRLAAFRAAREGGMSPAMAASLAKNLTVNFNRRGAYGPLINSLYLFFNAGIQGTAVILGAMRSPQVRKIVGGIVVTGAMVALFNSLAGDDDEDGEPFYDKIPNETRQKNIIIMIPGSGGRYIKIPMPWGYNAFFGVGRVAVETAFGRKPLDAAADVMTGFIDAFNPIGGAQSLLKMISPTITDPIVDLAMNRDFADRPIAPDQKSFGADVPNAQRFWNSVGPGWRMVTDFLTTVSGGDKVRPGAIDLSPEWLEYLFGVATGSAGQFAGRTVNSAAKMMDPTSDWTVNDVPFARRVLGSKAPWVDKAAFFERLHDVEQQKAYLKRYAEAGDTAGRDAVVAESRDKLGLEKAAHASQKAMADIRRARDAVWKQKDRGQIDDAAYRERIQALKDREQEIVTRFNRIWLERIEKPRPE